MNITEVSKSSSLSKQSQTVTCCCEWDQVNVQTVHLREAEATFYTVFKQADSYQFGSFSTCYIKLSHSVSKDSEGYMKHLGVLLRLCRVPLVSFSSPMSISSSREHVLSSCYFYSLGRKKEKVEN